MSGPNTSTSETVKQQAQNAAAEVKAQAPKAAKAATKAADDLGAAGAPFMKLPGETFRFASHRFDRQMTHMKTLMGCRSPADFFDAQSRFATEAVEEYIEEAQRVVDLASEIGTDYIAAWGESVRKT